MQSTWRCTLGFRRIATLILAAGFSAGVCGCASVGRLSSVSRVSPTIATHLAWGQYDSGLLISRHSREFAAGWKAGYLNVLTGGDGRAPIIPPERFWIEGSLGRDCNAQHDWLKGFAQGARCACQSGLGHAFRPNVYSSACGSVVACASTSASDETISTSKTDERLTDSTPSSHRPKATIRLLGIQPIAAPSFHTSVSRTEHSPFATTYQTTLDRHWSALIEPPDWPGASR